MHTYAHMECWRASTYRYTYNCIHILICTHVSTGYAHIYITGVHRYLQARVFFLSFQVTKTLLMVLGSFHKSICKIPALLILGFEPRASNTLGKHSMTFYTPNLVRSPWVVSVVFLWLKCPQIKFSVCLWSQVLSHSKVISALPSMALRHSAQIPKCHFVYLIWG